MANSTIIRHTCDHISENPWRLPEKPGGYFHIIEVLHEQKQARTNGVSVTTVNLTSLRNSYNLLVDAVKIQRESDV